MTSDAARPRLNITIDRMVLKGFPAAARDALLAGFQAELRRLAGTPGLSLGDSYATRLLRAAPFRTAAGASPRAIGAAAARELMTGLRR